MSPAKYDFKAISAASAQVGTRLFRSLGRNILCCRVCHKQMAHSGISVKCSNNFFIHKKTSKNDFLLCFYEDFYNLHNKLLNNAILSNCCPIVKGSTWQVYLNEKSMYYLNFFENIKQNNATLLVQQMIQFFHFISSKNWGAKVANETGLCRANTMFKNLHYEVFLQQKSDESCYRGIAMLMIFAFIEYDEVASLSNRSLAFFSLFTIQVLFLYLLTSIYLSMLIDCNEFPAGCRFKNAYDVLFLFDNLLWHLLQQSNETVQQWQLIKVLYFSTYKSKRCEIIKLVFCVISESICKWLASEKGSVSLGGLLYNDIEEIAKQVTVFVLQKNNISSKNRLLIHKEEEVYTLALSVRGSKTYGGRVALAKTIIYVKHRPRIQQLFKGIITNPQMLIGMHAFQKKVDVFITKPKEAELQQQRQLIYEQTTPKKTIPARGGAT